MVSTAVVSIAAAKTFFVVVGNINAVAVALAVGIATAFAVVFVSAIALAVVDAVL